MPAPKQELWDALSDLDFDTALNILKQHPQSTDLINSTNEDGYSPLIYAVEYQASVSFMQFVIQHPHLDLKYGDEALGQSNVAAIIETDNADLLGLVIDKPQIIYDGDKLSFETAKASLEKNEKIYATRLKKHSKTINEAKEAVESSKTILSMIRDASILHAIATDDAELFDRLEAAGAKPTFYLNDAERTNPGKLLTEKNPRLNAWFARSLEDATASITNNPNSLFSTAQKVADIEAEQARLQQQFLENKARRLASGAEARAELVARATTVAPS